MKIFQKDNQIKSLNRIVIIKDGMQILNPTEEMVLEDGWVEMIAPELTPEQILLNAKKDKIKEIERWDNSLDVNEFFLNGCSMWFDKAARASLKLRFDAEVNMGETETVIWHKNLSFEVSLEFAIDLLYQLEVYAAKCYDVTQRHIANVKTLETVDELAAYDYTSGYPEKLEF